MLSRWLTFLGLVLFLGGAAFAGVQQTDTDPQALGYRPPTEEELSWEYENELVVEKVRLNRLGLERIQALRQRLGLSSLNLAAMEPVPFGSEIAGRRRKDMVGAAGIAAPEDETFLGDGFTADDLPRYVDNSTLKYFPPIRTQGSIGSCAQFATIYYVMTHNTALARDWDAKSGGDDYRFSPKWSYNMVNGGADNGSSTTSGLYIALYHGAARWSKFPYGTNGSVPTNYLEWSRDAAVWRDAIDYRCENFYYVYDLHTSAGRENLKAELNNGLVLVFCTNVSDWGYTTISNDPATTADDAFVGRQIVNTATSTSSNHCMTIAGYNDDIWCDLNSNGSVDANEKGAFLIANSWGSSWRNGGFVWFSYGILNSGVWSSNRAAALLAKPSYSPDLVGEFTLYHAKRNDLTIQIGSSGINDTLPTENWSGNGWMIDRDGGAYAFDGTGTPCSGSFVFDFTDLAPVEGLTKKFYLRVYDRYENEPATLQAYKLIDYKHGYQEIVYNDVPQIIDNGSIYASVLHAFMENGSVVVDNQDGNTASSGSWSPSTGPYPWAGESLYGEGTATFRWMPNIGAAGVYQVYAWWTALASRTTAAPYQISHRHGDTLVTVNQEINGGRWNKLGAYEFLAGSGGYVELSNAIDGNSCADAIRLAPNKIPIANNQTVPCFVNIDVNFTLTGSDPDDDQINFTLLTYPEHGDLFGTAPDFMYRPDPNYLGPDSFTFDVDDSWAASTPATVNIDVRPRTPASQIIDNRDQNTEKTGSWMPSTGPNPWEGESLSSSGAATFRWLPLWHLPEPVSYKVYTWWTALSSRGSNVPYRISHAAGITEKPVNQMINGGTWHFLGNYMFSAGPGGYVEVADTDTGNSCADAVKLVRNSGPVALDQQALAFMDTLSPITLTARDQDDTTLDYVILSDPNHGELSGTVHNLWYTPEPGYLGGDSFTFKAFDGALESNEATMFINVVEGFIELSTSELIYYGLEGDSDLTDQVFTIRNSGGGSLDWQITEDSSWLTVVPASGSSTGEEDMVTVLVDVTGLSAGVYVAELTVSDPDAHNSPQSVTVTVNVLGSALSVPSQFATMQQAIDYALDGMIIVVADGVYTGDGNRDLDFHGKEIILRSENGPENCIINCQGVSTNAHRAFHFHTGETANSVLDGFTITGGRHTEGAGIYIEQCSPTIRNCIITGNVAGNYGGGFRFRYGGPTIINCTISHNQAKFGGGIYDIYSTAAFLNCVICENTAGSTGGAIRSYDGDFSLVNCTVSGNSAPSGGGLYISVGEPTIKNSIVYGNLPGEIYDDNSAVTITYSDVRGNWNGPGNIDFDPCFVKAPPNGDYHLQSQVGHWDTDAQTWIADPNTSIGIDAGDPSADYSQELWPDGGRVNMGAYGGTAQASMSLSSSGNVADLNRDGIVNYNDWCLFVDKWCFQELLLAADLNRDGRVNTADCRIFALNWLWHK